MITLLDNARLQHRSSGSLELIEPGAPISHALTEQKCSYLPKNNIEDYKVDYHLLTEFMRIRDEDGGTNLKQLSSKKRQL